VKGNLPKPQAERKIKARQAFVLVFLELNLLSFSSLGYLNG
jgi:hypothetical protein